MISLKKALSQARWIGFDLDDTLHDFRGASSKATDKVFALISEAYSIPYDELKAEYTTILRQGTANAFTDGRTSHSYRRERFSALLSHWGYDCSKGPEMELISNLLECYESTIVDSMRLKPGAAELLGAIRDKGMKIMVITEGPQDSQERAVKQLLDGKIDTLVTTNKFGISKIGGLFPKMLEHFAIAPSEMIYVGDSLERDIWPATKAGIVAVHFDEKQIARSSGANFTVDNLTTLTEIVNSLE